MVEENHDFRVVVSLSPSRARPRLAATRVDIVFSTTPIPRRSFIHPSRATVVPRDAPMRPRVVARTFFVDMVRARVHLATTLLDVRREKMNERMNDQTTTEAGDAGVGERDAR